MCGRLYCGDTIKIDPITKEYKVIKGRGDGTLPETELNSLFGIKNLGQSRRQLFGAKGMPTGYKEIDILFM